MRGFDLVLTYNWGAFDAVMARRLFGVRRCPSRGRLQRGRGGAAEPERNRYRRLGLRRRDRLVVPSERLETIARTAWGRSRCASPTASRSRDCRPPEADRSPASSGKPDEVVIGTVAGLRAVKNLPRLVRAFAAMTHRSARLVIVGEGPESERIAAEARGLGVAARC